MHNRISIVYPRSWSETRRIFLILDDRWSKMITADDKRLAQREWVSISEQIKDLYKESVKRCHEEENKLKKLRSDYKKASSVDGPKLFAEMMSSGVNINFHNKVLKTAKKWMKKRRILKD